MAVCDLDALVVNNFGQLTILRLMQSLIVIHLFFKPVSSPTRGDKIFGRAAWPVALKKIT